VLAGSVEFTVQIFQYPQQVSGKHFLRVKKPG